VKFKRTIFISIFHQGNSLPWAPSNDIPTRLAESNTGHYSGGSAFNTYGTVGYTLEEKLEVLKKIEIKLYFSSRMT
jgi:hypothetical protein